MFRIISLLALATALTAQTPPGAWQYGHPDAKLLVGIDVKTFRESALGQSMRTQMAAQMQLAAVMMPMPFPMPGLEFLDQIDRVLISSPALSNASKATSAPFLMVIEGRFRPAQLKPFGNGLAHTFKGVEVRRMSKTGDGSIALLNANTVLLGDEKSLHAAIDRRSGPAASPLLARATQMAAQYDFWMIMADSISKFQPASAANPFASQVEGMEFGFAAHEGMQLDFSLNTKDEQFAQLLTSQIQVAMLSKANTPEAAELAKKLFIRAEGKQMRMQISLTQEEMEQQMRTLQSARASGLAGSPTAAAAPAAPPPAKPGKVKIYGLDEGVREIQLSH